MLRQVIGLQVQWFRCLFRLFILGTYWNWCGSPVHPSFGIITVLPFISHSGISLSPSNICHHISFKALPMLSSIPSGPHPAILARARLQASSLSMGSSFGFGFDCLLASSHHSPRAGWSGQYPSSHLQMPLQNSANFSAWSSLSSIWVFMSLPSTLGPAERRVSISLPTPTPPPLSHSPSFP